MSAHLYTLQEICDAFFVSRPTVMRWKKMAHENGLELTRTHPSKIIRNEHNRLVLTRLSASIRHTAAQTVEIKKVSLQHMYDNPISGTLIRWWKENAIKNNHLDPSILSIFQTQSHAYEKWDQAYLTTSQLHKTLVETLPQQRFHLIDIGSQLYMWTHRNQRHALTKHIKKHCKQWIPIDISLEKMMRLQTDSVPTVPQWMQSKTQVPISLDGSTLSVDVTIQNYRTNIEHSFGARQELHIPAAHIVSANIVSIWSANLLCHALTNILYSARLHDRLYIETHYNLQSVASHDFNSFAARPLYDTMLTTLLGLIEHEHFEYHTSFPNPGEMHITIRFIKSVQFVFDPIHTSYEQSTDSLQLRINAGQDMLVYSRYIHGFQDVLRQLDRLGASIVSTAHDPASNRSVIVARI